MKKTFAVWIAGAVLLALPFALSAERKEKYISPNNDGVQDELAIPLKIKDKRLITSWQLVIKNKDGTVVRTIGNKVALPTKLTFKQFFKQLAAPKTGVEVPEKVIWNGVMDNGEYAPDGTYYYYFEASDDNGNTGKTDEYAVVVDTVAPEANITSPSDKVFGEGAKTEFRIGQTGSPEDLWTGVFKDSAGKAVRTFTWKDGSPAELRWNGTDDAGIIVQDGVYSYELSARDRAGNVSSPYSVPNIIYSAEKPVTNIMIAGDRYFSPGTDSKQSTIVFSIDIPIPSPATGNKLTSWSVSIIDGTGKVYRTYNQSKQGNPPETIVFDGKDEKGALLPEGRYQAEVAAAYMNGYEPAKIRSPEFALDTTKPAAKIGVGEKEFGGAEKPLQTFDISSLTEGKVAEILDWKGRIFDAANPSKTVKEFDFGQQLPASVQWNGSADDGKVAPNGNYQFELTATDRAGNTGVSSAAAFTLNTADAKIILSANEQAFSPNGDRVKDVITFTPQLLDAGELASYEFEIDNAAGTSVYAVKAAGKMPASFQWNGKTDSGALAPDGVYRAQVRVSTQSGSNAASAPVPVTLDVTAPSVAASTAWTTFSPDGDGVQDVISVKTEKCSEETLWTAEVKDSSGKTVKKYAWNGVIAKDAKGAFDWNGATDTGSKAKDGVYSIVISSEDAAGNAFSTTIANVTLDGRETKAFVTAEHEGISPNGDKNLDAQTFTVRTTVPDGIQSWSFDVKDENGKSVRNWSGKENSAIPSTFVWDGMNASGKSAEGTFFGALQIVYKKGNKVNAVSAPFVCSATPPVLDVQTTPKYFSPDNDGADDDLFIRLKGETKAFIKTWSFVIDDPKGRPFWKVSGKNSITERMTWDGLSNTQKDARGRAERVQSATDYPYTFTVTDSLGMTSVKTGIIAIDILVIRDGNVLKMAVPSIIFRSDAADFKTAAEVKNGLKADVAAKNAAVLNRIAEVLKKFKEYNVTVVGHANRVTDNPAEETENNPSAWGPALIPLSKERAEFVKAYLTKHGVSASRLMTDGKGGTELVADYKDKDNNWKNRRVEFILNK
ncbi:MAG: FlgD immunoglobulin-like domain containing protein [Treponema sp.]